MVYVYRAHDELTAGVDMVVITAGQGVGQIGGRAHRQQTLQNAANLYCE